MRERTKKTADRVAAPRKAPQFGLPELPDIVWPQREPVEPFPEPSRREQLGRSHVPDYEGPDFTALCFDLEDPSRVFVGGISERLNLETALGILETALEDAWGPEHGPLASGDPLRLVPAVGGFLGARRKPIPRYFQLVFDPGLAHDRPHLSKAAIRGFIDACTAALKGLADTPAGEFVDGTGRSRAWVQAACLTTPEPSWQLQAMPAPKQVKSTLDVPLLSESSLPPPTDDGRRSKVVRRLNYPALEGRNAELDKELVQLHQPVVRRFQEYLDQLAGEACPTAKENSALASLVNKKADDFGICLLCQHQQREYQQVRLKVVSRIFQARTPGRSGGSVYLGAVLPPLRAGPRADYAGPDSTGLCFDLEDPSRVVVGSISERLSFETTLRILEAALQDARGVVHGPLAACDPVRLIPAVWDFLGARRKPIPRYFQLVFDPGPAHNRSHLSKATIRGFIDACTSVLKRLADTPAGEFVVGTGRARAWVEAACLTTPEPSWQLYAMPAPKHGKPNLDVPLLSESSLPPPTDDGRRSKVVRRLDYAALEGRNAELDKELVRLHQPVVRRFQEYLDQLAGEACPTARENSALATLVNKKADDFGICLLCQHEQREYEQVRLKVVSGVFEARTPGRSGGSVYLGAVLPPLRAGSCARASNPPDPLPDRPQ